MSESLGQILAHERRARAKTLADVEAVTRVRAKMLQALEDGDYESLPAAAYTRGYIINYSKFLDIDPAPLLELYAKETRHAEDTPNIRLPDRVPAQRDHTTPLPTSIVIAIVALVTVVALFVWGIGRFFGDPEEVAPLPTASEATATVEPEEDLDAPAIIATDTAGAEDAAPASVAAPFVVRIQIAEQGASWLRVTVDGLNAYEGILTSGESKEFDVTDSTTIRVGMPTAVTILRDGTPVAIPTNTETPELTLSASDNAQ